MCSMQERSSVWEIPPCGRTFTEIIMPRPHRAEALSDDARLTSVCLSVAYIGSGLSREQRGLGRLKLAHMTVVTDSDTSFKVKRSKVNLQAAGHIVAASRTACLNANANHATHQCFCTSAKEVTFSSPSVCLSVNMIMGCKSCWSNRHEISRNVGHNPRIIHSIRFWVTLTQDQDH